MIPYAKSKFPPVPILNIALSVPGEGVQTELVSALIDTGSDFTLVPEKWLWRIDTPRSRPARVRGLWSAYQEVTLFLVDIHLEIGTLPGVEVVRVMKSDGLFENEEVVLGRNVLNMLILLLEGPQHRLASSNAARADFSWIDSALQKCLRRRHLLPGGLFYGETRLPQLHILLRHQFPKALWNFCGKKRLHWGGAATRLGLIATWILVN